MADATNNNGQPTTALAPIERGDAGAGLVNQNLDPAKGKVAFWCSFTPSTARERAVIYNAMTGQVRPLSKMVDDVIMLRDVIFQGVDLANAVTGEITSAVRVILIDETGKMYGCVSRGIHESIKKLCMIVGMPTYDPTIPVIVRSQKAKVGQYFTLEMAGPDGSELPTTVTAANPLAAKSTAKAK